MSQLVLHERLLAALATRPGRSMEEKAANLHAHIRSQGVRGVHSTRFTLRRWLEGKGTPPGYWLEMVAEYAGVNFKWLQTGESDAKEGDKGIPPPLPPPEAAKASKKGAQKAKAPKPPKKTPPEAVKPPQEPPPREPEKVSIPSVEDVHGTNARTAMNFLENTESVAAVEAVLKHEPSNPKYHGGRKTVMDAGKKRLMELQA